MSRLWLAWALGIVTGFSVALWLGIIEYTNGWQGDD